MRFVLLTFVFLLLPFTNAFAQEPIVLEQVTSDGLVKVQLVWPEIRPNQLESIPIKFLDPETNALLEGVTVNYNIAIIQQGNIIEMYLHFTTDEGKSGFGVVFPEDGKGAAEVVVEIVSITKGSDTIQIDEELTFNVEVVPEFGTIAIIVMAFAFVAILAIQRLKNTVSFPLKA